MPERIDLREFQAKLLESLAAAHDKAQTDYGVYIGFEAGNRKFLLHAGSLSEVATATVLEPIPLARPWNAGAANLKGAVYAVTDLLRLLGEGRTQGTRCLVLADSVMPGAALLYERLTTFIYSATDVDANRVDPEPGLPAWVVAGCRLNSTFHHVLDATVLAADPRFSNLQSGEKNQC